MCKKGSHLIINLEFRKIIPGAKYLSSGDETIVISDYGRMTSSNGNIFRVTGPLSGEFTGHRWIPLTKTRDAELCYFLWSAKNGWVNNRDTGDLRRHRGHYDITAMVCGLRTSSFLSETNPVGCVGIVAWRRRHYLRYEIRLQFTETYRIYLI